MSSAASVASLLKSDPRLEPELRCVAETLAVSDDNVTLYAWNLAARSCLEEERLDKALRIFVEKTFLKRDLLWECRCLTTGDRSEVVCRTCGMERSAGAVERSCYRIESFWKEGRLRTKMRAIIDKPIHVVYSYAHADARYKEELDKHLEMQRKDGSVTTWHDGEIAPGSEWALETHDHFEKADIFLLFVSVDYLNSVRCYEQELKRAMERHERRDAVVIPILVRACDWESAPFGKLQGLPAGKRPVDSFRKRDGVWTQIARAIRAAVERIKGDGATTQDKKYHPRLLRL